MTVAYEEFLPEVLIEVDGCPSKVAENAIRNAVIELCQKARIWREQLDEVNIFANVGTYDLDLPNDTQLVTLLSAKYDGGNISAISEDELETVTSKYRVTNWRSDIGQPVCVFASNQSEVTLIRIPEVAPTDGGLVIWAAIAPSRDSYECPETIYNEYLELIAHGAKSRLMGMSTRPWANPQLAVAEERKFNRGVVAARIKESKSHGKMSNTVSPRPLA